MKQVFLYLLISLLTPFTAQAQIIDGPANIRTRAPHDAVMRSPAEILISLNDGQAVQCVGFQQNWYYLSNLGFLVKWEELEEGKPSTNTFLYDTTGQVVGRWITAVDQVTFLTPFSDEYASLIIEYAVTHENNLLKASVPEWMIYQRLQMGMFTTSNLPLEKIDWDQAVDMQSKFCYPKQLKLPKGRYTAYSLHFNHYGDIYQGGRMHLLFDNEELIALAKLKDPAIQWKWEGFVEHSIERLGDRYITWIKEDKLDRLSRFEEILLCGF